MQHVEVAREENEVDTLRSPYTRHEHVLRGKCIHFSIIQPLLLLLLPLILCCRSILFLLDVRIMLLEDGRCYFELIWCIYTPKVLPVRQTVVGHDYRTLLLPFVRVVQVFVYETLQLKTEKKNGSETVRTFEPIGIPPHTSYHNATASVLRSSDGESAIAL